MVSIKIVSRFTGPPLPSVRSGVRDIAGDKPLYSAQEVNDVLNLGESAIVPWTRKCISDLKKYEFEKADVIRLIRLALSEGEFKGSEWCNEKTGGAWAACDSYRLFEKSWVAAASKEMLFEYYVKFAIGKSGKVILTISCHLSEDRN